MLSKSFPTVLLHVLIARFANCGQLVHPHFSAFDSLTLVVTSSKKVYEEPLFTPETSAQFKGQSLDVYILFNVTNLQMSITTSDIVETTLTLKTGYFSLFHKHRNGITMFVLLTGASYHDTARAIQNSGFASSDTVPFFISIPSIFSEILHRFANYAMELSSFPSFHANLIFYVRAKNLQFQFCYFCTGTLNKLVYNSNYQIENLLITSQRLNSDGNSRSVFLYSQYYMGNLEYFPNFDKCFLIYTGPHTGFHKFLEALKSCDLLEEMVWSPFQNVLNISFVVLPLAIPFSQWAESDWSLYLRTGEAISTFTPNEYASTRGAVHAKIYELFPSEVGFCMNYYDGSLINFNFSFVNVFDIWVILLFGIITLVYSAILSSFCKGFALISLLVGYAIPLQKGLRRRLATYVLATTLLSWTYQSFVSSENLRIHDLKSLPWYARHGLQIYVPPSYLPMLHSMINQFHPWGLYLSRLSKAFEITEMSNHANSEPFSHLKFLEIVRHITFRKVALYPVNPVISQLNALFRHYGRLLINKRYSCQIVNYGTHVPIPVQQSYRYWGPLSFKLNQVFQQWFQAGWMTKMKDLWTHRKNLRLELQGIEMVALDRFPPARPLNLGSFLGVSGSIHVGLGLVLLLFFALKVLWNIQRPFAYKGMFNVNHRCCFTTYVIDVR